MTDNVTITISGIAARVRNAVEASPVPDPLEIAQGLRAELGYDGFDGELAELLDKALQMKVENCARALKREALQRAEAEERAANAGARIKKERKEADDALAHITARHQDLVAERFFATWKETPTGRKFLGECTADDLEYSSSRQLERSEDYIRAAARDERLASALKKNRCKTVRDLGYEKARTAVTDPEAAA